MKRSAAESVATGPALSLTHSIVSNTLPIPSLLLGHCVHILFLSAQFTLTLSLCLPFSSAFDVNPPKISFPAPPLPPPSPSALMARKSRREVNGV